MIKGTTPTHIFDVDIDTAFLKEVKITYSQDDVELFHKKGKDCVLDGHTISTKLTQEETFLFKCNSIVEIQIRGLTKDGDAYSTDVIRTTARKCLDSEVLK